MVFVIIIGSIVLALVGALAYGQIQTSSENERLRREHRQMHNDREERIKRHREELQSLNDEMRKRNRSRSLAWELALDGLHVDGGHHKQWYLEEIAKALGSTEEELAKMREDTFYESGIAP